MGLKVGDVCKLREAPKYAILRAVEQEQYAVPYFFEPLGPSRHKEGLIRTQRYYPSDDRWEPAEGGGSYMECGPEDMVRIVGFLPGRLPEEGGEPMADDEDLVRRLRQRYPGKHVMVGEDGSVVGVGDTADEACLAMWRDHPENRGESAIHYSPEGTLSAPRSVSRPRGIQRR